MSAGSAWGVDAVIGRHDQHGTVPLSPWCSAVPRVARLVVLVGHPRPESTRERCRSGTARRGEDHVWCRRRVDYDAKAFLDVLGCGPGRRIGVAYIFDADVS